MIIRKISAFFVFASIMALTFACQNQSDTAGTDEKWIELFNGKDLNDWFVKIHHHDVDDNFGNTFRAEDGLLKVRYDQYDQFNERFGHIYYKKPFSHFHLKFEYRFADEWRKDAPSYTILNSGVMYHSQDPRTMPKEQDWPISIEMQLLAGLPDGKPRPTGNMCSPGTLIEYNGKIDSSHCINSTSKTYSPEEWVSAELIVLGDSLITHIINGDTVMKYSHPQIGGGVVNRFDPAQKLDGKPLKEGYIAFQSEGQPIDFRNIVLKDLSTARKD